MDTESLQPEPFRPSVIHKLFSWVERLPGPYWLYYASIVVITGLLNHIVAWRAGVLAPGEISWPFAFTAFYLAYYLFANDFLFRVARESLVEFRPILDATEQEFDQIVYEFTHLPAISSTWVFGCGAIFGLALALYLFPTSPEMNRAFPALEVPVFSLSLGMVFLAVYVVVRAFRLVGEVFGRLRDVDIYDQDSIYAMSRYSAWLIILAMIPSYLTFVLAPSLTEFAGLSLLVLLAIVFALMLAILWMPLRRVNRELTLEKRRLLKELDHRIRALFDRMHSKMDGQEFEGTAELREMIDGLLTEREFIHSIRTWPWRPRTLTGLLSAVILPVLVGLLIELASRFISP